MPTYDYECQKCGHVFEVFHTMSESPKVKCEKKDCGGKAKKQIGAGSGLIFKGSGFYITDYKDKKSGNGSGASSASSESSDGASKSESASESKSEAKSDASSGSSSKAESKSETKKSKAEKAAK